MNHLKAILLLSVFLLTFLGTSTVESDEVEEINHTFTWEKAIDPEEDLLYIEDELVILEDIEMRKALIIKKELELAKQKEQEELARQEAEKQEAERKEAERQAILATEAQKEAERVAKAKSEEESKKQEKAAKEVTSASGKHLIGNFESTAYAVGAWGVPGTVTANGTDISGTIYSPEGYRIIAVDTRIIPMNSVVEVHVPGWEPFLAKASDTGGRIKGNIIDLLMSSPNEAINYGRKQGIKIYRLN